MHGKVAKCGLGSRRFLEREIWKLSNYGIGNERHGNLRSHGSSGSLLVPNLVVW